MGKLAAKQQDTEELSAVAPFTADEIQIGLDAWTRNLKVAQDKGDILGVKTAHEFLDAWLDRRNRL